ncbi:MAG: PHP domain-containing protein [Firmicutes bacterium]|nr:PHP domain-containing protein [Bacillota bacterium]
MIIDLHTHTNASDGTLSPEQLIHKAVNCGVRLLSITDHDSIAGIKRATEAVKNYRIDFIPGVELSADYEQDELHILGYFINPDNPEFSNALESLRVERMERIDKILAKLEEFGVNPGRANVDKFAEGESIGRPHIARAMQEAGFVGSVYDAFQKYLKKGCPCYVPRRKLTPAQTVKLISDTGGIPVAAHPGLMNNFTGVFKELMDAGLKGIEAFHPEHTVQQMDYFFQLAKENNLIVTAGSDYHGPVPGKISSLGMTGLSNEVIQEIYNLYHKMNKTN